MEIEPKDIKNLIVQNTKLLVSTQNMLHYANRLPAFHLEKNPVNRKKTLLLLLKNLWEEDIYLEEEEAIHLVFSEEEKTNLLLVGDRLQAFVDYAKQTPLCENKMEETFFENEWWQKVNQQATFFLNLVEKNNAL